MQAPTRTSTKFVERPIVERPRLTRLLDRATTRIILLCAPAGYGKTTLARQWLTRRKHVWYSCNAASADVAGLAADLFKAITEVHPHLERDLRLHLRVAAEAPDQLEHLTEVVVDHFAAWPADTLLAIDDYQLIAQSPASEALFAALVQRTSVPLVIIARARPTWVTARARAYGDIYELDQASLAITRAESGSLLGAAAPLVSRELASLCRGWPALVALAGQADQRSLPRRSDPMPSWMDDFIAEEVIPSTQPRVVDLATVFAPLGNFDLALFSAICGEKEGRAMLLGLRESGFLAMPYRSHRDAVHGLHPAICSSLLLHSPTLNATDLASRVGAALLEAERWDDAWAIGTQFSGVAQLKRVMRQGLYPLLHAGRLRTLKAWLAAVPSGPLADLALAELSSREGDFLRAESLALGAASSLDAEDWIKTQALITAGRSAHLSHSDVRAANHYMCALDTAVTDEQRSNASWGGFVSAAALNELSASELRMLIEQSTDTSPSGRLRYATGIYAIGRTIASMAEAYDALAVASGLIDRVHEPLVASSFLHAHSNTLAICAEYESSITLLGFAIPHSLQFKIRFALPHHFVTQAVAQSGLLLIDAAKASLNEALAAARSEGARRFVEMNAAAAEARLELITGDVEKAVALSSDRWHGDADRSMRAELLATHAIALFALGDRKESTRMADAAATLSQNAEPFALTVALQVMIACEDGLETEAFSLADELAQRKLFDALLLACRMSPATTTTLARHQSVSPLIRRYIEPASSQRQRGSAREKTLENPFRLTPKELEISKLLAVGLSNRELAKQLFISEATAKLHLRHIYGKLGVRSRTEAAVKLLRNQPSPPQ